MNLKKFILAAFLALVPFAAQAGSGKAILPYWGVSGNVVRTYLVFSNLSPHTLTVNATFYAQNGTPVTTGVTYDNLTNGGTVIAPNSSAYYVINGSPLGYGYAVITWQNQGTDNDAVALVATGLRQDQYGSGPIQINNGLPF